MNSNNTTNLTFSNMLQNTLSNTLRTFLVNPLKLKIAKWTPSEDEKLIKIVQEKGNKNWKKIAEYFENKTPIQCFYRWNKITRENTVWSDDEVERLKMWVEKFGNLNWTNCAKIFRNKSAKNCKDKWNQIIENENSKWTYIDEAYLLMAVNAYGTCWSKISKLFPTHLENSVKNKFYAILKQFAINNLTQTNVNSCGLKLAELLIFLPIALNHYRNLIGEEIYNNLSHQFMSLNLQKCQIDSIGAMNNTQINICSKCKDKLKQIIKKNLLSNIFKKSFMDYNNTNEMNEINSLEKLKNTSQKIEKLKEILNDVNKNILNFN